MPFTPHKISAVVLFGKKSCNRLLEILNYWQTILVDHAWDRFLFLCVTAENEDWQFPGEGEKTAGTQELLDKQIVRCMHMKIKLDQPGTWKMPAQYLEALQYKLNMGSVMVHCICDDLSAAPPAGAAVSLMESAVSFLGKGNVNCMYYLMLREKFAARQQQKDMALMIHERQPDAVVYLLSNIANDGSRLHKFELRRAAMCEILVAALGKRFYTPPMVYTLGYTSLNANDQELYFMRRNAIADVLRQHYEEPITKPEAWDILTMKTGQPPQEFNEFAIPTAVSNWVNSVAEKFVINPSDRELENLRILAGISAPEEAVGLQDACNKFFEVNMTARTDIALRRKVEIHISNVIAELRKCINIQGFPVTMLHMMTDALKTITGRTPNGIRPVLPKKKLLQPKDEYLNTCARLVSNHVRGQYVAKAAAKVAACLLTGFEQVEKTIEKVQKGDNFAHVMQAHRMFASEEINLQNKYPKYAAAITETINDGALHLFGQEWLQSAGTIYDENFKVDENAIRALMENGINTLHRHMPRGFNATFMDTLHAEFDSDIAMEGFLDKFLFNNNRHMFNCPFATTSSPDTAIMYFVDDDLERMSWVINQKTKAIIANNDNIEKLSFHQLDKDLQWLAETWQDDNRYFGLHTDGEVGEYGSWVSDGSTGSGPAGRRMPPVLQMAQSEENPRNLRLTPVDDRFMLTWTWEAGVNAVLVSVNGQPPKPVASGKYMLEGGMDVTSMVVYGRNEIVLTRLNHSAYGRMSLCGKQYPVRFRFVPSNKAGILLKVKGRIPANSALLLCERTNEGKHCFYPVAARGLNGEASYDGLKLAGTYELTASPEEKFPVVKPVQDISL